jgi:hypothetical protein
MEKECAYCAVEKCLCTVRMTFKLQISHDKDPGSIPDQPIQIFDGQGNTGAGICPKTLGFPCQYYSTVTPRTSLS